MKVLLITNMYPTAEGPSFGTFVEDQLKALRRAGVDIDVLFINGRKNRFNYLWGPLRLWKALICEKYDLIHCHYIFSGLLGRLQWSIPVVLTHHGLEVFDIKWVSAIVRLTHRWFNRVIVVSGLQRRFLGDQAVALIPCGIDLEEMRPISLPEARSQVNLPLERKLVLWAGEYWRPEKQFHLVRESMDLLKARGQEVELVLVSGKPHSVIPLYMSACDVLLLTSSSEGSPMVIKEAMACNLPIVSTDVGDVRELISDVEGCFLVGPDKEEIVEQLEKVLACRKRTNGREKIKHLGAEETARRVLKVYNDAISSRLPDRSKHCKGPERTAEY